jgi:hypothetical protein
MELIKIGYLSSYFYNINNAVFLPEKVKSQWRILAILLMENNEINLWLFIKLKLITWLGYNCLFDNCIRTHWNYE